MKKEPNPSALSESVEEARIKVFETNLSLAYDELAYIVHYRNNDYLCIGLRLHRNHTDSFCVGDLAKFEDHEIKYFKESKFKLEDSPLWSLNFAAWLKEVYLPFQYHQAHHSEEVETKYNTLIEGLNDEINAYEVEVEKLTRELTDEAYNGQQLLEQRNKLRDMLSKVLNFTASMDEWDEIEKQIRKEIGI